MNFFLTYLPVLYLSFVRLDIKLSSKAIFANKW